MRKISKLHSPSKQFQVTNLLIVHLKKQVLGFPGGAMVKNLPANVGDMGSSPGPGRSHMPRSN